MSDYHIPVLLDESIEGLNIDINKKQVFVDLTYGGGSHTKRILDLIGKESVVYAFDQDLDALNNTINDDRLVLVHSNYRYFQKFLRLYGVDKVDGVLADLGVSSFQFDQEERGFSYRSDQSLDMRMNREQSFQASDILNNYSEEELVGIFSAYGEIRNSKQLAKRILDCRQKKRFLTSFDLTDCIDSVVMGNKIKYYSQLFQALRIEVNDEINALSEMLHNIYIVLKTGGRMSVISYHSLEDRLVKNVIKTGNTEGRVLRDEFGHIERKFIDENKGVVVANEIEVRKNPRARSAKLRIATKI